MRYSSSMVSKDVLVVAAGIAIVAIALIGVFSYEDEYKDSDDEEWINYIIEYNTFSQELTTETGEIGETDTLTHTQSIDAQNLTDIRFEVSWTDRYPGRIREFSDNFKMKITSPSGTIVDYLMENPSNSTQSPLIINAKLRDIPKDSMINTTDRDQVNRSLQENISENGMGKWAVNLEVDIEKPAWVLLRNRMDAYTLKITYTHYKATVSIK